MRYLIIASSGFKDVAFGQSENICEAFENVVMDLMQYAISHNLIPATARCADPIVQDAVLGEIKPLFKLRYIE